MGMMIAPNLSKIRARVLRVEQSPKYPDKWELEFEIMESESLSGPNFARAGERVKGFTFRETWDWAEPVMIEAAAEYLGGPAGGQFQLTELRAVQ